MTSNHLDNNPPQFRSGFFNDLAPISDQQGTKIVTYYSYDSYNYWQYDPDYKAVPPLPGDARQPEWQA